VLVREDRPLALAVAERTGVTHESPQAICLVGGKAVRHASHHEITAERLRRMLPAQR
jgi:bacillithiol system protein YtxJ